MTGCRINRQLASRQCRTFAPVDQAEGTGLDTLLAARREPGAMVLDDQNQTPTALFEQYADRFACACLETLCRGPSSVQ